MRRFIAYVQTWKVGSRCEVPFEVADEEFVGLTDDEQEKLIEECAQEAISGIYEWSWTEVES